MARSKSFLGLQKALRATFTPTIKRGLYETSKQLRLPVEVQDSWIKLERVASRTLVKAVKTAKLASFLLMRKYFSRRSKTTSPKLAMCPSPIRHPVTASSKPMCRRKENPLEKTYLLRNRKGLVLRSVDPLSPRNERGDMLRERTLGSAQIQIVPNVGAMSSPDIIRKSYQPYLLVTWAVVPLSLISAPRVLILPHIIATLLHHDRDDKRMICEHQLSSSMLGREDEHLPLAVDGLSSSLLEREDKNLPLAVGGLSSSLLEREDKHIPLTVNGLWAMLASLMFDTGLPVCQHPIPRHLKSMDFLHLLLRGIACHTTMAHLSWLPTTQTTVLRHTTTHRGHISHPLLHDLAHSLILPLLLLVSSWTTALDLIGSDRHKLTRRHTMLILEPENFKIDLEQRLKPKHGKAISVTE
jgi:hypothetical protein